MVNGTILNPLINPIMVARPKDAGKQELRIVRGPRCNRRHPPAANYIDNQRVNDRIEPIGRIC
jgi:hypothetical protein